MGQHPRIERGERWTQVLDFLEESGGVYQRRLPDFAHDLGIPQRSLGRLLHRMRDLNVIRIVVTGGDFGEGRYPNKYELLVTSKDWQERGLAILEQRKRDARNERRRAKRYEERTAAELAADSVAARHIEAARAEALAEAEAEVGEPFDVDAWTV